MGRLRFPSSSGRRLSGPLADDTCSTTKTVYASFFASLEAKRTKFTQPKFIKRKKVDVVPGKSVGPEVLQDQSRPTTSTSTSKNVPSTVIKMKAPNKIKKLKFKRTDIAGDDTGESSDLDVDLMQEAEEFEQENEAEKQLDSLSLGEKSYADLLSLQKVKRVVGEYVVFTYEGEYFPGKIESVWTCGSRMEGVIKLTSQNPLSLLVKFGIMAAWNATCAENCSGHGECHNGTCLCEIQFDGEECHTPNLSYYVAFASVFFVLALVCLIQLVMCVVAEYQRMKAPSVLRACHITTQKLLYFLVFLAASIRGAYFTSPALFQEGWSSSLMYAYYPLLLISYCLLQAAFQEGWSISLMSAYYPLLFISYCLLQAAFQEAMCDNGNTLLRVLGYDWWGEVVIVRYSYCLSEKFNGGVTLVGHLGSVFHLRDIRWEKPQFLSKSFLGFVVFNIITYSLLLAEFITTQFTHKSAEEKSFYTHVFNGCYAFLLFIVVVFFLIYGVEVFFKVRGGFLSESPVTSIAAGNRTPASERIQTGPATDKLCESDQADAYSPLPEQKIDVSQLHQSRFGLLSQALMLMIVVGFLFSETLSEFWKKNPEQLWILNPKRILKKLELDSGSAQGSDSKDDAKVDKSLQGDDTDSCGSKDCWICYDSDRQDMGPLIQPCQCRGDVGSVHHDCLRRWLVESAPNPDSLRCKVCNSPYQVQRGEHLDWQHGFTTQHWLQTVAIVTCMCVSATGAWVTIQLFEDAVIRCLAAGSALLIQYVCVRFLGLHTVVAYQRAKVSALSIVGGHVSTISETVAVDIPKGPQQAHI
uniref:RING-CH-type domain-containing protein n=2 Tax=Timema TaxID=61471 RepID=A0A7R9NWQ4_9NEOP|nr:unnamed protein product [Timema tahoe]